MSEIIYTAVISTLSAVIGGYVIFRISLNKAKNELPDILLDAIETIEPELPKLMAKPEVQQFFLGIGALIGNGAKGGFGLNKSGKFRFEDLIGLGANYLLNKGLPQTQGQPPQQGATSSGTW